MVEENVLVTASCAHFVRAFACFKGLGSAMLEGGNVEIRRTGGGRG
jgi:hypothetical protein